MPQSAPSHAFTCLQDTQAFGVGAAYTSTLASTLVILAALRAAHLMRKGILGGQPAVQRPAQPLPDLPAPYCAPQLALSPDSRWCAVSVEEDDGSAARDYGGLYLYDTHTGQHVHTLYRGEMGGCFTRWTSCSTRLLVLMGVHELNTTSLLAFEDATGHSIKPKWTKQAAAVLRGTSQDITLERDMLFSPDGSMLLCVQDYDVPPEEFSLHILDIPGGSIAAASPLSEVRSRGLARYEYGDTLDVTMLWHPASDGFVVPGCTFQLDDQPFKKAGLATGHCPLPAFLGENSAFSPMLHHAAPCCTSWRMRSASP